MVSTRDMPFAELIQEGNRLVEEQKFDEAIKSYSQANEIDPESATPHCKIGSIFLERGDLESARQYFQKAVILKPSFYWAYYGLAKTAAACGQWKKSEQELRHALKFQPNSNWLHYALGETLSELGCWEEATLAYQSAIDLKPDNALSYQKLGETLLKLERWEDARQALFRSIEIDSRSHLSYFQLGIALENLDRLEEAIAAYHHVTVLQADFFPAQERLNKISVKKNDPQKQENSCFKESDKQLPFNLIDRSIAVLEKCPDIYEVDLSVEKNRFLSGDEFEDEQISQQVLALKEKLTLEQTAQTTEALFKELAITKLALNEISLQVKILSSKLLLRDAFLPDFLVPNSLSQLSKNIVIEGGFPLSDSQGFYHAEYDSEGRQFRWTGSRSSFYFDLLLDRTEPLQLTLKLINAIVSENINEMRCFADETEILLNKGKEKPAFHLKGVLPVRNAFGYTRLSFLVPRLIKASEFYGDSQDNRTLGVAFSELAIKPLDQSVL